MKVIEALRALLGEHKGGIFWTVSWEPGAQPVSWLAEDLLQALEDEESPLFRDVRDRLRKAWAIKESVELLVPRSGGKDIYTRIGQGRPLLYTGVSFDVAVADV